jgi:hypothetical protein
MKVTERQQLVKETCANLGIKEPHALNTYEDALLIMLHETSKHVSLIRDSFKQHVGVELIPNPRT